MNFVRSARKCLVTDDIVTGLREMAVGSLYGINIAPFEYYNAAADEIERLRDEVARLGSFLHPIGTVVNGYSSSQAENTWISADGTITNHDPNTETGFWVRLFHNECDRSAHLEREIERLRKAIVDYVMTISDCYSTDATDRDALELLKQEVSGE